MNDECTDRGAYSPAGTGTTNSLPLPVLTISKSSASVEEGMIVEFTIKLDPAPATAVDVNVAFEQDGIFAGRYPDTPIRYEANQATQPVEVTTVDDGKDEEQGGVTMTVLPGSGYRLSDPSISSLSERVAINDNDVPATPTALRVNGNLLAGDNVTLRWDWDKQDNDLANVRFFASYYQEHCDELDNMSVPQWGVCREDRNLMGDIHWQPNATGTRITLVDDGDNNDRTWRGRFSGPDDGNLYHVRVMARIVDDSAWSAPNVTYPTAMPLPTAHLTRVGTVAVKRFLPDGEYDYRICSPNPVGQHRSTAIPMDIDVLEIQAGVLAFVDAVRWTKGDGNNIIRAVSGATISDCYDPDVEGDHQHHQIIFLTDAEMDLQCPGAAACLQSWNAGGGITKSSMMFNGEDGALVRFGNMQACRKFEAVLLHETGHAFGLTHHKDRFPDPMNPMMERTVAYPEHTDSVLYYQYRANKHNCGLSHYDVAALMATYQSR